jgi:hypothetical protein
MAGSVVVNPTSVPAAHDRRVTVLWHGAGRCEPLLAVGCRLPAAGCRLPGGRLAAQ